MKQTKPLILALASLGFASTVFAGHMPSLQDVDFSGDAHGTTAYNVRGNYWSDNEPSLGIGLKAAHSSGGYASYGVDTIKMTPNSTTASVGQLQHALTLGYAAKLGNGVRVGGGVTQNYFTGHDAVRDLSFGEAFGFAEWKGLAAKVSYNINSAKTSAPRVAHGDTYGELGYTYRFGQASKYSVGGDVGYYWYANQANDPAVRDGLAVANLRAGYAYNEHLSVGVVHQAGGRDPYGNKWQGDRSTRLDMKYVF